MKHIFRLILLCAVSSVIGSTVSAQTAQITGRVTDSNSAVVPGAQLTVTNVETGIGRKAVSNEEGYYTAPQLPPGHYRITAQMSGFKPIRRENIALSVDDVLRLDFTLEVGDVQESVEVTDAQLLLESATATVSTVIPNQKIVDLPLVNRNIMTLAALAPTVRPVGDFGNLPVSSFGGARMSISGGPPSSNNFQIDGVAAENFTSGSPNIFLSVDATEEFRIVTRNPSAEHGRTGGGVINVVSKSGTNDFHGTAYWFHRNRALNANDFFFNRAGRPKGQFILNQYGATLGGPIVRQKTFFFFNFEGFRLREQLQAFRTVPTPAQRNGDFRGTLDAQGRQVMIYDPFTTRPNPTGAGFVRDVISCNGVQNVICPDRFHPVARELLKFYPLPNTTGVTNTNANNFFGLASLATDKNIYGIKLDHNFTPERRLSGRYTYDSTPRGDSNFFGNLADPDGSPLTFLRHSVALNYTDALSPTLLFEARAGSNRYAFERPTRSFGFDVTTLGFSPALKNLIQLEQFPRITVADVAPLGPVASDRIRQANNAYSAGGAFTKTLAAQTIKFGAEQRVYQLNNTQRLNSIPALEFNFTRGFTQGPNPNTAGANLGHGLASFLLGAPASGGAGVAATSTYTVKNFGIYVQDDWKVTPKLTLNLGLRWEYESGMTDRYGALANFDPDATAIVGGVNLRGLLDYPGMNGNSRGHRDAALTDFGPRLGFAYQLFPKTVVRAGYGIYHLPTTGNFVTLGRTGFDFATPLVATNAAVSGGFRPVASLTNPLPQGLLLPVGNAGGPATGVGTEVSATRRTLKRGYSQQFNFNVQQELPGSFLLEVGYAGNRGVSLPANRNYDYLPFAVRQANTVAQLQQTVANPYCGIVAPGLACNSTVQRQTLLDTYPQFTGVTVLDTWADSTYHALTVKAERRLTQGLSLLAAYTFSKLIDNNLGNDANGFFDAGNNGVQDWDNLRAERAISVNDLPHRLVVTTLYDLPFGKSGPAVYRALVGGWRINGILTLQSGNPIGVTTAVGNRPFAGSRPNLAGDPRPDNPTIDNWLNPAAFEVAAERAPGNAPRNLPDYRTDGLSTVDFSLLKTIPIREQVRLQFRAEAFNFTNTPTFGSPGTGLGGGNFGVISSTVGPPRQIQLALKLYF